jgi:NTE family protein
MIRLSFAICCAALLAACALPPRNFDGEAAPRQAAVAPLVLERPVLALALGSGGARGFAHVGVIKALEQAGIVPDIVTGSSSGAVVAALYASGLDAGGLERAALEVEKGEIVDFALFGRGWVRGEALQDYVNRMVEGRRIEELARPFAVVATEAATGRMTIFNRGDTGLAVRASASVPDLFVPPRIRGREYVDGGLTSPVPVRLARAMGADIVIAVDVSWFAQPRADAAAGMARHGRSGRYGLLAAELEAADVVVVPRVPRTRMLDFDNRRASIAAGEAAGREAVARVRELLAPAASNGPPRN